MVDLANYLRKILEKKQLEYGHGKTYSGSL